MTPIERNGSGAGPGAERDSRLDRAYRAGAGEEPPAHLDAAILAAARREVGARPRAISARLRAWRVPVSIAAVVVLSVSVATLVREEGGGKLEQSDAVDLYSKRADTAPSAPATAPEPAHAPDAAKAVARAKLPAVTPTARESMAPGDTASAKRAEAASRREAASAARSGAPMPQPFQGAPAAPERRSPVLAADQAAGAGAETRSFGTRAGEANAPVTPAETAPAPKAAARAMQRDRAATEDASGSVSAVRPPAAVAPAEKPGPRAESRFQQSGPGLADTAPVTALLKELEPQAPEKWLEKIEALRREGRKAESDELLAEFKRRFPTHPLPPALR